VKALKFSFAVLGALALGAAAIPATAADSIPIGHLVNQSGETSPEAKVFAQGVSDSLTYINQHGGVSGRSLDVDTVDYGYDALKAVAAYAKWIASRKPVAVFGWGTADSEALVGFVARDEVAFVSGSSSARLTDPLGKSAHTTTPAPFNFFYGPSYSDGCRALVQWAGEDWRKTAGANRSTFLQDLYKPKFVHVGANHPYPNAPRESCAAYAKELGFEVLAPVRLPLTPGDFKAQCQALRESGANYAFLANTAESNIALAKSCASLNVPVQFMTNIYGWDEDAARIAREDGNGMVWVVTAATWGDDMPGMTLVRDISRVSDPKGETARPVHYMRGVCSVFLLRDALNVAAGQGEVSGASAKKALEQMRDHVPAGLEGVCQPTTWTPQDHRGTTEVTLYRSNFAYGSLTTERVFKTKLPLKPDWLGW
jgi:branched-chain amino acid transport system substrate-binding protein